MRDRLLIIAVMRKAVIGLIDPEVLGQEAATDFQSGDPCRVGLQRQSDQLIQHGKIVDRVGVGRFFERRFRLGLIGPSPTDFKSFFDVTNRAEVLVQLGLVFLIDSLRE